MNTLRPWVILAAAFAGGAAAEAGLLDRLRDRGSAFAIGTGPRAKIACASG